MRRATHPSQLSWLEVEAHRRAMLPPEANRIGTGADTLAIYTWASGTAPCGAAFAGKSLKPLWRYRFRSLDEQTRTITTTITRHHEGLAAKTERRASRKAAAHGLQPGDVLVSSWGYDQTNIDFYEVTRVMDKAIEIRPIRSETVGGCRSADSVMPVAGSYTGEPMRKIPSVYDGRAYVTIEHASACKWEGRPYAQTAHGCGH